MTDTALDSVLEVAILHIHPGDAIAIRSLRRLTTEQAQAIQDQIRTYLPDTPVLVFPPELHVETIIRKGDADNLF